MHFLSPGKHDATTDSDCGAEQQYDAGNALPDVVQGCQVFGEAERAGHTKENEEQGDSLPEAKVVLAIIIGHKVRHKVEEHPRNCLHVGGITNQQGQQEAHAAQATGHWSKACKILPGPQQSGCHRNQGFRV